MGPGQSLMHLASDAVRAAAESPFLEEAVKRASAILCCISMPSPKQRFAGLLSPALELDAMLTRVILSAVFVSACRLCGLIFRATFVTVSMIRCKLSL